MKTQQTGKMRWQWEIDGKFYSAQVFAQSQTIIWAAWRETGEGPKFEPGYKQPFAEFITNGAPEGYHTPGTALAALRAAIKANGSPRKRRWLF